MNRSHLLLMLAAAAACGLTLPARADVTAGPFLRIYDPSVDEVDRWYINDHCFMRGPDHRWHLFGITHAEPADPHDEDHLAHATADLLTQPAWRKQPYALSVDEGAGEIHLWAPHVVEHNGTYYMYYCGGAADHSRYQINLATSTDLHHWTRHPANPMVRDGFDARDPYILRDGARWIMYYTANSDPAGGHHIVAARTSDDLVHWSDQRHVVFTDPAQGTFGGPTESPTVIRRGDTHYLFIGPRPAYRGTAVFRSDNPLQWSLDNQVGQIFAHAAEVIRDADGRWYVSHCGWGMGGVYLASLNWNDGLDGADSSLPVPAGPPGCATRWPGAAAPPVMAPYIDGDWWAVAHNPPLGRYQTDKQQPVDFAIWQAADGTWRIWSCIRGTRAGGTGRLFHGWKGEALTQADWAPLGVVMTANTDLGETAGGLQAPHVVREHGRYVMAYGDWNNICFAVSNDGSTFQRVIQPDGMTGVFSEGRGANTRDAMLLYTQGLWHCYYTAFPAGGKDPHSYVFCRTAEELLGTWSPAMAVNFGGRAGAGMNSCECPHVVEVSPGQYYLFRTQAYGPGSLTTVYHSTNPRYFGIDDDRHIVGTLPVAAPEIFRYRGQWYIAALDLNYDGIRIARLGWQPVQRD